jgi:hypothetical protein
LIQTPENIDHDRLFKELLSTFFWEFLELFLPEVIQYIERDSISFLPEEVFTDVTLGERRKVDLLAQVRFQGKSTCFLIHLETQSYSQPEFERRMFHYFARLDEKYGLPIYPVALFSFDTPQRAEGNQYIVKFPDRAVLEFSYVAIQLNRLNWRDFLQQQNPVAAALMAKMKIQPKERAKVKAQCLRLLATLRLDPARMQLISGFVDTYLRLNEEEEAIFKAEIDTIGLVEEEQVMEIVTSWMERGITQGIRQGIEREMALVLRLINRRLGGVNPTLEAQIRDLSIEKVEDLGEALLDFQTEADLVNWLNRN